MLGEFLPMRNWLARYQISSLNPTMTAEGRFPLLVLGLLWRRGCFGCFLDWRDGGCLCLLADCGGRWFIIGRLTASWKPFLGILFNFRNSGFVYHRWRAALRGLGSRIAVRDRWPLRLRGIDDGIGGDIPTARAREVEDDQDEDRREDEDDPVSTSSKHGDARGESRATERKRGGKDSDAIT